MEKRMRVWKGMGMEKRVRIWKMRMGMEKENGIGWRSR